MPGQLSQQFRSMVRNFPEAESELAPLLLSRITLSGAQQGQITEMALDLASRLRGRPTASSTADALMREYDLSSAEGLALMALAEALLRIPDAATRDLLIRDKIGTADWAAHQGASPSWLVNLSTYGLRLGAGLLGAGSTLAQLGQRLGGPVIRSAVLGAMKTLGGRFVFAETIEAALKRAGRESAFRYSFDMLGEAARTHADAARYDTAYTHAIAALAKAPGANPEEKAGISVKLSALHPRYEATQQAVVKRELLPRLLRLAEQAAAANIGFTIDAEEADRLELSLDLLEAVAEHPPLAGWQGLGLAVQAYSKRLLPLLDGLESLAARTDRRLMVRLVKGAYWDSEIKRAQEAGLAEYPVYTDKALTDLSYLAGAERLFAGGARFYPQFATHNAYTVAAIREMAAGRPYEFQRLHGMGTELAAEMRGWNVPVRTYAPVGPHKDLLAYLVRRLLENGANSSFVNQLTDFSLPLETLIASPISAVRAGLKPRVAGPRALYAGRLAAPGIDFSRADAVDSLAKAAATPPFIEARLRACGNVPARPVVLPADPAQTVGTVAETTLTQVSLGMAGAVAAFPDWARRPVGERAAMLRHAADLLEADRDRFLALLAHEAGRTLRNGVAEIRETIDFLNYYAAEAERLLPPRSLPGVTGEDNQLSLHGRGVFACISPWNFPLSIFTGQVAAALVTGNTVLAKPAGETPLIAYEMVRLLHQAGFPESVLHYLPGDGATVGAAIVADPRLAGVVFTGSTATARSINQVLAAKPGPLPVLIAETGGQNAMIVDSSALLEQTVGDIMISAFDSAGQRCSALRLLAVQTEIAEPLLEMLSGAMATLTLGSPADPASDIGPVISAKARAGLERHLGNTRAFAVERGPAFTLPATGHFFAPRLLEIDRLERLTEEVFGPVLHVVRWRQGELPQLVEAINRLGYGLTLGLQTRIGATVDTVRHLARVGNLYVNRSQIGAVVESQPFGGESLSGTGPKAGGPHYLPRFCVERTVTINTAAAGGNAALLRGEE